MTAIITASTASSVASHPGRILHPGRTSAPAQALEPLSFWGGVDLTGAVVDVHHPAHGTGLSGWVVVMPASRGSSSGSSVLVELIRLGTAPAGFVLSEADAIITTACLVAAELYSIDLPVVLVAEAELARIAAADSVEIAADRD